MAVIEEIEKENEDEIQEVEEEEEEEGAQVSTAAASARPVPAQPPAAPASPAAPEFKVSQIAPMLAMLALQKYNLEEMGLTHHVEVAYVVVQLLCFGVIYFTYDKINKTVDNGIKIKIPEVKQMGQVVSPAKEQTTKEYDMDKLKEAVKQPLIGFVILGGIYYKWGSLLPLVMQVLMTPLQLYEAPLTQIHLLGKKVNRPFAVPSMFGLPSAPEAPAEAVEAVEAPASKPKKEKKKQ